MLYKLKYITAMHDNNLEYILSSQYHQLGTHIADFENRHRLFQSTITTVQ